MISSKSKVPLRVRFFAANNFSILSKTHGESEYIYGDKGSLDVTDYVEQLSWSFSVNAPYETISLMLQAPMSLMIQHVLPNNDLDQPTTGFWVVINAVDTDGTYGRTLAWGHVDSLNVSMMSDMGAGTIMSMANLTATSWVNYVDRNSFLASEAKPFSKTKINYGSAAVNDAAKDKFSRTIIDGSEIHSFLKGFKETAEIASQDLQGADYVNQSLGRGVAGLFHEFAVKIGVPASFFGEEITSKVGDDRVFPDFEASRTSFSELISILYATKQVYEVDTSLPNDPMPTDPSLLDLSRFGNHGVVPIGGSPNFMITDFEGGIWSWVSRTFGLDPNVVELFPTLIEVDSEELLTKHDEVAKYAQIDPFLPALEQTVLPFPKFDAGRDKKKSRMLPVILYRLKPITDAGANYPLFDANEHNDLLAEYGLDPRYRGGFAAENYAGISYYPASYNLHKVAAKHRIVKKGNEITSFNYVLSNNAITNAVTVRSPAANSSQLQFGYGFSNVRRPVYSGDSVADFGLRRQEVLWNVIYKDLEMYPALAEYFFAVFYNQGVRARGSFSCVLDSQIRAGMWVTLRLGDEGEEGVTASVYVEEVEHSITIDGNGGFIGDSQVTFSSGDVFAGLSEEIVVAGTLEPFE